jgi:Uncharacterized protein conserved in bacteria
VTELTANKKDPKLQVELIKEYFEDMGKTIPFEVNLEITPDGKGRVTLEANEKFIGEFWDICRKTMWNGANQVLNKKTSDLKKRIKALGKEDIEESKAIYEELVKLDEMLEIEDRILNDKIAGVHDLDSDYKKNIEEFREQRGIFKEKTAKFGHIEYIDPRIGKTYQWIETMLKMGKPSNIKWAAAAMFSAPGKFNDVLDFMDDGLMTKLRNGGGEDYIKTLRKGQGLYWDEQVNQFLKKTPWEGNYTRKHTEAHAEYIKKFYPQQLQKISQSLNNQFEKLLATRGLKIVGSAGSKALDVMQKGNRKFNEGMSSVPEGRALGTVMMVYSLKDELPLYYNYIGEHDFGGLAAEFFKRRVPFGGAVERGVMGDYYGVAWEMTATLIPPVGILSAAKSVGESIALTSIEAVWSEDLERFIDNLYENADFKIVGVESVGEDIKISQWALLNVTYKSKKYNFNELIEMETADAREMAVSVQKIHKDPTERFPIELIYNGLFEWFNAKDAFEHKFEKTDSWIQLISQMEKNKYAGKELKEYFQYKKYARFEQIKVEFLTRLKVKLEERRSGEQSLVSGHFPKMYEELLQITDQLDVRVQLEEKISEEFGGGVMQFMTSLKDLFRGAVRDIQGDVDVWDVYEELSAFVTKNLRTYKRILEGREYAEGKLVLKKHDQGLRILTGPYFLTGIGPEDASSSQQWFGYVDQVIAKNEKILGDIKVQAKVDPSGLDLTEGAYDLETLNRLVYHESFKDMWKQVNSRNAAEKITSYLGNQPSKQSEPNEDDVMSDQDRALTRFALHEKRIEKILDEFRKHYELSSEKEEVSSLDGLEGLLKEIMSIMGQIIPISDQIKGLVERIKAIEKHVAEQTETIKALLGLITSQDTTSMQGDLFDDSVLNESGNIDVLSKSVATLRNSIENETLIVCQGYEKIKEATEIPDLERLIKESRNASEVVTEKFQEYSQIQHKLNPLKNTIQQTLSKLAASKNLVIDQSQLKEVDASLAALKEMVASVAGLVGAVKDHSQRGEALNAQAASVLEELKEYDPALISDQQKQFPEKIRGIYGQINGVYQQIVDVSSDVSGNSSEHNEKIAGFDSHLRALQVAAQAQKTATGRSFDESENLLKDVFAQIDAAQLFYPPIEEANKNAAICSEGTEDLYDQKASRGIPLPDVVGMSYADAVAAIDAVDLLVLPPELGSPTADKDMVGTVEKAVPEHDGPLQSDDGVTLYLYDEQVVSNKVPNVIGQQLTIASAAVKVADLNPVLELGDEISDPAKDGTIYQQTPEPGTEVAAGSDVTLLVYSLAEDVHVIPNVIGQELGKAADAVKQAGFIPVFELGEETEDPKKDQTISRQTPGPGVEVESGKEITLFIFTLAEKTTTIPDLSGMSISSAQKVLQDMDLPMMPELGEGAPNQSDSGHVYKQYPGPGMEIMDDVAVQVWVYGEYESYQNKNCDRYYSKLNRLIEKEQQLAMQMSQNPEQQTTYACDLLKIHQEAIAVASEAKSAGCRIDGNIEESSRLLAETARQLCKNDSPAHVVNTPSKLEHGGVPFIDIPEVLIQYAYFKFTLHKTMVQNSRVVFKQEEFKGGRLEKNTWDTLTSFNQDVTGYNIWLEYVDSTNHATARVDLEWIESSKYEFDDYCNSNNISLSSDDESGVWVSLESRKSHAKVSISVNHVSAKYKDSVRQKFLETAKTFMPFMEPYCKSCTKN